MRAKTVAVILVILAICLTAGHAKGVSDPSLAATGTTHALPASSGDPSTGAMTRDIPASSGDLNAGRIVCTVTDVGAIGWYDPIANATMGSGFSFDGNPSALFHAGLLVATEPLTVVDACYGSDDNGASIPFNFTPLCPVESGDAPVIDQYLFTASLDGQPDGPPLVMVARLLGLAWADDPNDAYIVLEYEVESLQFELPLFVGLYADWDIGTATENEVGFDPEREMIYMSDASAVDPNLYGIAAVDRPLSGARAVYNPTFVYPDGEYVGDPGFEDADKFDFLTTLTDLESDLPDDWSVILGVGPSLLPPGERVRVAFVMAAGVDLSDLQANVDAARTRYGYPLCRPVIGCP